jgi:hypothetical protein
MAFCLVSLAQGQLYLYPYVLFKWNLFTVLLTNTAGRKWSHGCVHVTPKVDHGLYNRTGVLKQMEQCDTDKCRRLRNRIRPNRTNEMSFGSLMPRVGDIQGSSHHCGTTLKRKRPAACSREVPALHSTRWRALPELSPPCAVVPAAAQGILFGGDATDGASIRRSPQRPLGLFLMASTSSTRTFPE